MKDPYSVLFRIGKLVVWHRDKGGVDGGCIHFMRAHHGDPEILKKITSQILFDWNSAYQPLFNEDGTQALSTPGIVMNWMFTAAFHHFGSRKKAVRFIQKNLAEIMLFAENPVDTAATSINNRFGDVKRPKEDRAKTCSAMVYAWVLRECRPWWKNIVFHIHHWRFSWEGTAKLPRKLISACRLGITG